jgi:multidrug efflux pump subunit AcrA (membrane-fusion protein)
MLLDERRAMAVSRVERLASQADAASVAVQLRDQIQPLQARLDMARTALRGLENERGRNMPRAPASGVVRFEDPDLRVGTWVARNELLATVIGMDRWQVEAYMDERDTRRLKIGSPARFYAEAGTASPIEMSVSLIEQDATRILSSGVLTLQQGGSVAAREADRGLIPDQSIFRVRFDAPHVPEELRHQVWRGRVVVSVDAEPIITGLLHGILAILWREGGF